MRARRIVGKRAGRRSHARKDVGAHLDAKEDDRVEVVLFEQREHWGNRHGEGGLGVCAEEEAAEGSGVELWRGRPKGWMRKGGRG